METKPKLFFYRYGSICEPDVIESFKRLGLDVVEETAEIREKNLMPGDCVKLVADKLLNGGFAFVFTINFFPWLSDVCNVAKIVYISLIVDSPVMELYSYSLSNACNRVFLFDRELYKEFESYNKGHVFAVPLATNMVRNDRVISGADDAAKARYKSDISFVGSTYQEKCPFNRAKLSDKNRGFFDGIIEAQLKVYGYNFIENTITDQLAEEFLDSTPNSYRFPDGFRKNDRATVAQLYVSVKVAEQERLRALRMLSDEFSVDIYTGSDTSSMPNIHNRGFARSLDEMPLIFNQSKINLNITAKSIRSGLSLRVFDVLGCGGFLITNYQAELPEYFEIGRDLVAYESMEHLQELCRYYLAHDDEREEIAAHGRETVIANYTYDILLLKMIDMAFPAI
jgi:spore maturation protein CgeB